MRRTFLIAAALATPAHAAETISYSYDARGRLVQVVRSGTVNNGVTTSYALDKADNRTLKTTTGSSNAVPAQGAIILPIGGFTVIPIPAL
jgi:hypothetical protein